ncbi:hypothetical protein AVEN_47916-1 [Araneus ventricosus]|uniref:Uncharacterized protein n=1 Tax=Araneus ventricosus TaxID=182803 RepID=A0A4Y2R1I2_ARAVE|nr:hypothetical protein AVEN_156623-1 [Araneus ventricosus]GBN69226.1 hypothetical protein AVEN_47916-1 [Araneus ventricosus]
MTLKLFTIDELIEDKLPGANLSDDEQVIPSFFKDAVDSIEKLGTHFFCQKNSEKIFNELNPIHDDVFNTHRQHRYREGSSTFEIPYFVAKVAKFVAKMIAKFVAKVMGPDVAAASHPILIPVKLSSQP